MIKIVFVMKELFVCSTLDCIFGNSVEYYSFILFSDGLDIRFFHPRTLNGF